MFEATIFIFGTHLPEKNWLVSESQKTVRIGMLSLWYVAVQVLLSATSPERYVACTHFLRREGTFRCRITESRCLSGDLPQGGLEVPCMLTFRGEPKDTGVGSGGGGGGGGGGLGGLQPPPPKFWKGGQSPPILGHAYITAVLQKNRFVKFHE